MADWLHLEIPTKLVGEDLVSGNDYIKTYRTEILLPKDSKYQGYCFLHPTKLVSSGATFTSLTYNETFTFTLVKKDREPGQRYKRYTLNAAELLTIYEPEVARLKEVLAKKERKRLAQIGSVEILGCRANQKYYWVAVFRYGKKLFYGDGGECRLFNDMHSCRVIAEDVPRSAFESVYHALQVLCENYRIVQDVRHTINQAAGPHSSDKTVAIYDSFYSLADQWEMEFYEQAAAIIDSANRGE